GYAFSPDGRQYAATYPDRSLRLFDLETGRELKRYPVSWSYGAKLHWNPRRPFLAVGVPGGHQTLDLATSRVELEATGMGIMNWDPEGRILVGAAGHPPSLPLWDTATRSLALPPLCGHKQDGVFARFNHAGNCVLSTDWSGLWRLWNARTGQLLLTQPAGSSWMDFSADDRWIGI